MEKIVDLTRQRFGRLIVIEKQDILKAIDYNGYVNVIVEISK